MISGPMSSETSEERQRREQTFRDRIGALTVADRRCVTHASFALLDGTRLHVSRSSIEFLVGSTSLQLLLAHDDAFEEIWVCGRYVINPHDVRFSPVVERRVRELGSVLTLRIEDLEAVSLEIVGPNSWEERVLLAPRGGGRIFPSRLF